VANFLTPGDAELIRVANYVFRSKIVKSWRNGRILLAGDAAHEMPPFLAQGMVSGIRYSLNLSWKLDLVLAGQSAELLDSYQLEREPHVRFITEKAIELGRVQTMRDPEKAKERDARMLAARRAKQKPEKLRYPPLQRGLIANHGGLLPQGRVSDGGQISLFDDIAGAGWCVVTRNASLLSALAGERSDIWKRLGGSAVALAAETGQNGFVDTGGVFGRWFDEAGADAAVVRPDRYVYGTAKDADGLSRLLERLAETFPANRDQSGIHPARTAQIA
jgi:hypothetical protein